MIVHKNIFNASNMQKSFWNTINFFQILIIEILELMKPIPQMFVWQFTLLCPIQNFQNFIIIVLSIVHTP
jgi:hypothetical protein